MMIPVERLETSLSQIRDAAERLDREVRDIGQRARARRDAVAANVQKQAKASLREAQNRAATLRDQVVTQVETQIGSPIGSIGASWDQNSVAERVAAWRKDAADRVERGLERAFDVLPVVSQRDFDRMNRKLSNLQRKLRKIEKERSA